MYLKLDTVVSFLLSLRSDVQQFYNKVENKSGGKTILSSYTQAPNHSSLQNDYRKTIFMLSK